MRSLIIKFGLLAAIVSAGLIAGLAALAHSGATGIINERMMAMKDLGANVKALTKLDWSSPANARAEVEELAKRIDGHADAMTRLFPEGSNKAPSEALDVIWSDPEGFNQSVASLKKAAMALGSKTEELSNASDVLPYIKQLGSSCQQCHADYRKKK